MSKTAGQYAADFISKWVGSWTGIISYNLLVLGWLFFNAHTGQDSLALNLFLSWLAGVQAPVIMISQHRQEQIQRKQDTYMLHIMEAMYEHLARDQNRSTNQQSDDKVGHLPAESNPDS